MSERWPGGIVRATPVTPTGPLQNGTAPGVWTLDQANYWIKQGLWPTAGNFLAVEDVFSTYLYTGNGSNQTITNGIDLAGKGGLVWIKARSSAQNNVLADTANGTSLWLSSNTTDGQSGGSVVTAFSSTGFNTGGNTNYVAGNGVTYVSWTFREAANFFDVVTFTANSSGGATFSHSLGGTPGCIMFKRTSGAQSWYVYHRSIPNSLIFLDLTNAAQNAGTWVTTTSTSVTVVDGNLTANETYVAYLYAHDTSSTGIIQCGSFTANGGTVSVNLGWEPQWLLVKRADSTSSWFITDNMRGFSNGNTIRLQPNTSSAEGDEGAAYLVPTATGFNHNNYFASGANVIYIAIRRGPMRTPTSGTTVFAPIAVTPSSGTVSTTNFPTDMMLLTYRPGGDPRRVYDRLRGIGAQSPPPYDKLLTTNTTDAETDSTPVTYNWWNTGFTWGSSYAGLSMVSYAFRRAPSFFDEVCFAGAAGSGFQTVAHNLGAIPELVILKRRNGASPWQTLYAPGAGALLRLNETSTANQYQTPDTYFTTNGSTYAPPTATSLFLNNLSSADNWVAYLFASCPGVSKVGSYTGTGALQTVNCGFTTGARFVLIKRTDSTGDWYVWDSARGITSGNDPYLLLNSTAAEVTGTNYVDTDTTGFQVTAAAPAGINASGGTYIFLAVA